jgi:hypothetical protein
MAKRPPPGTLKVGQRVYLGADIRRVADQEDELGSTLVTVHLLIGGVPHHVQLEGTGRRNYTDH